MTLPADEVPYAHLWDGSEPGWTVRVTHWSECQVVVVFDPPGPTVRDVATMRDLFDELRTRPATAVWAQLRGQLRIVLERNYTPMEVRPYAIAARARGLRIELPGPRRVIYQPFNTTTQKVVIIEDDELATRIGKRMQAAGVSEVAVEAD